MLGPSIDPKILTDLFMVSLCIFREARGEVHDGKVAVGCVIRNRVQHPGWYGKDWFSVVTKPWQFSSFNKGDPNSIVFGAYTDPIWLECVGVASDVMADNLADITNGATFYFDKSLDANPPDWSKTYKHTADVANFHCYSPT
jgi:N-acetylmuramoyl-L-alanine amidase